MPQRVETVAKAAHARALMARTLDGGRLAPVLAAQGGPQMRDLDDGRADVRMARGEDLLVEVGHVARIVAQGRVEGEHPLVLEEGQMLLDVGCGLDGHGFQELRTRLMIESYAARKNPVDIHADVRLA